MTEADLLHPYERLLFVVSIVLNIVLLGAALALVTWGGDWLAAHPRLAEYARELEALTAGAVLAPIALVFLRNTRRASVRGNSARVSREQFPEVYDVLERQCAALGMRELPELYLSEDAPQDYSSAFSAWRYHYIVLGAKPLLRDLEQGLDIVAFLIGRELGRLRLGHTQWWDELLLVYVLKIPLLRNPLLQVRTLSHDRYGAYLAPNGIRGLVVQVTGHRVLERVNFEAFARQAVEYRGFWVAVSSAMRSQPHLALRLRALIEAGLFDVTPRTPID